MKYWNSVSVRLNAYEIVELLRTCEDENIRKNIQ